MPGAYVDIEVKDSAGNPRLVRYWSRDGNVDTPTSILTPESRSGSYGVDWSGNPPAIPNVGNNFAGGHPVYPGYHLIKTIPDNPDRASIDIENISGGPIVIVRDDGTAPGNTPPVNASLFALDGGAAVGRQGGAWNSQTFRGRLQIYGPTGAEIVTVMED